MTLHFSVKHVHTQGRKCSKVSWPRNGKL